MFDVPAICTCGHIFPSGLSIVPGVTMSGNRSQCPKCGRVVPVLDGYMDMVGDLIRFVVTADHTRDEKQEMFEIAAAAARKEITIAEAEKQISGKSEGLAKQFQAWVNCGSNFVIAMATVGIFALAYLDSKGNEPIEAIVAGKLNDVMYSQQPSGQKPASEGNPLQSMFQPKPEKVKTGRARAEPPYKNRKARRAEMKKNRKKPK